MKRNSTKVAAIIARTAIRMKRSKCEKAMTVLPTFNPLWRRRPGSRGGVPGNGAGQPLEDDE